MIARGSRRVGARAVVLVAALGLVGAVFAGSAQASVRAASPLGTKDPAKGTPITIGVISNGKTPTVDQSIETPVAEATAKWINDYKGGLGGHPINVTICNDTGEAGKAGDCANQMIQQKVAAVV